MIVGVDCAPNKQQGVHSSPFLMTNREGESTNDQSEVIALSTDGKCCGANDKFLIQGL